MKKLFIIPIFFLLSMSVSAQHCEDTKVQIQLSDTVIVLDVALCYKFKDSNQYSPLFIRYQSLLKDEKIDYDFLTYKNYYIHQEIVQESLLRKLNDFIKDLHLRQLFSVSDIYFYDQD